MKEGRQKAAGAGLMEERMEELIEGLKVTMEATKAELGRKLQRSEGGKCEEHKVRQLSIKRSVSLFSMLIRQRY